MKNALLIRFAVAAAALATFAYALAAPAETLMQQNAVLITSPNVAQDLKLTETQLGQSGQIMAAYHQKYEQIALESKEGSDPRTADYDQARLEMEGKLLALLTPPQRNRLKQIVIQQVGTDALQEANIAQDLGLNAAQRTKIKAIYDKVRKAQEAYDNALGDALDKIPDPGSDDAALRAYAAKQQTVINSMKPRQKQYLAAKAEGNKQIIAVMTPAQRKKWAAMPGKILKPG